MDSSTNIAGGGAGWEESLANLEKWAKDDSLKLVFGTNRKITVAPSQEKRTLFENIKNVFSSAHGVSKADQYKDLKHVLGDILSNVKDEKDVEKLKLIYAKIQKEFERSQQSSDVESLIHASDLLEGYNTAFQKDVQARLGISRIKAHSFKKELEGNESAKKTSTVASSPLKEVAKVHEKTILLAQFNSLESIVKSVEGKNLSKEQIGELIDKSDVKIENVPKGKIIEILYRHRFAGRFQFEKTITKVAELKFGSTKEVSSVLKLVKFFNQLHIDLWVNVGGDLYSFSEAFGYDLRTAKSFDQSFTRSLTDVVKDKLLETYKATREKVQIALHNPDAQPICSNSFCRLTQIHVPKGGVKTPISIRDKVISQEEQITEEYYGQKHPFTIHELLGGYPEGKGSDDATNQGAFLGHLASFVDKHDTEIFIQRLAPADIHHYYATADCEVLSCAESCAVIEQELFRSGQEVPYETRQQLLDLEGYFSSKEQKGGKLSTVNIAGSTLGSVSTGAIRQESGILSTNDRKVMMVRNKDGAIAVHVFIGATAVNNVAVSASVGDTKAGEDYGSMAYGTPRKEEGTWIGAFSAKQFKVPVRGVPTLRSRVLGSIRDLRVARARKKTVGASQQRGIDVQPKEKLAVGQEQGGFEAGGSTVISIYFSRDIAPTPQVENFLKIGSREVKKGEAEEALEIQCKLGDVLATPVAYQAVQILEAMPPQDPQKIRSHDPILNQLRQAQEYLGGKPSRSRVESLLHSILAKATNLQEATTFNDISFKEISSDEKYVWDNFINALSKRQKPFISWARRQASK